MEAVRIDPREPSGRVGVDHRIAFDASPCPARGFVKVVPADQALPRPQRVTVRAAGRWIAIGEQETSF